MYFLPTKTSTIPASPVKRASSSSSSNDCSGKNANSPQCQKPVTTDALTICLAVILPTALILSVLGYFLWINYRKDKRESLEHDPDFDENGEATALPDLPNHHFENPFHNRNSVRYPNEMNISAPYQVPFHGTGSRSSIRSEKVDPYLDHFGLPYQHQTGSKSSLDDYARHLGDTTRSSAAFDKPKNSQAPQGMSARSSLREQVSPVKKVNGQHYTNIPNFSTSSLVRRISTDEEEEKKETPSPFDDSVTNTSTTLDEKNEKMNHTGDEDQIDGDFNFSTSPEASDRDDSYANGVDRNLDDRHIARHLDDGHDSHDVHLNDRFQNEDDITDDSTGVAADNTTTDIDMTRESARSAHDDLFDSSIQSEPPQFVVNSPEHSNIARDDLEERRKSPRISSFNLLKIDGEEEDDIPPANEEQEEEIKRMKSVYRVYFDGEGVDETPNPNAHEFVPDHSNPLPHMNSYPERINNNLNMDTDYNKRMTTTSSIYTNHHDSEVSYQDGEYSQGYQQGYQQQGYPQQAYQGGYQNQEGYQQSYQQNQQFQNDYQEGYNPQYENVQQRNLQPLQALRNASDIRHSTLQTYTDFKPKKQQVTSPTTESWSSPKLTSLQSQSSFNSTNSGQPYTVVGGQRVAQTPSASQLARSSVVMINPVTEITKARTFKPAGSLPVPQSQYGTLLQEGDSDLIPGNRKSDVRRMMNSNF